MGTNATARTEYSTPRLDVSSTGSHPTLDDETWEGALEKVEAVFREDRLQPVLKALSKLGQQGVTVTHVHGRGRERESQRQWRGMTYRTELLPRVRIEMIVHQPDTDGIIDAICEHARTGAIGDGKIWVTPVSRLIRVRNGEVGAIAV
jgi:nitrogen regulatory protein P-II 1